jgi:hypothetical protein
MPGWFAPVISAIALFGVIVGPLITGVMQWVSHRAERKQVWKRYWVDHLLGIRGRLVALKAEMDAAHSAHDSQRYLEAASAFWAEFGSLDDVKLIEETLECVPVGIVVDKPETYTRVAVGASMAIRGVGGLIRREMIGDK